VNKLYKKLAEEIDLVEFNTTFNIHVDEYHGNTLEGPQINKVFNHIEEFKEYVEEIDAKLVDYMITNEKLKEVDQLVNNKELDPDFERIIDNYMSMNKSQVKIQHNKVHIIETHLKTYLKEKNHFTSAK
jgi:K+/H+ antiporter YhaU regulatory subunit KhtT